jgi:hypothetical protein
MNTELFFPGFEMIFTYAIIFAEVVYTIFAFITIRQVHLMNSSFSTPLKSAFNLIAELHFLLSIGLLLLSLLLLL